VRLVIPALLFAVAPAVYALVWLLRGLAGWTGSPWRIVTVAAGLGLALVVVARQPLAELVPRWTGTKPLAIGLGPEREAVVAALSSHTTRAARILWEDRPGQSPTGRWTALLPVLTDRAFLGGLDANAGIVHEYVRFADQQLADRWLRDWSDAELEDFCRRYNVGWVACWSPAAIERMRAWKQARAIDPPLQDGGTGCLFAIDRPKSFVLKGEAQWLRADSRRIALGEVTPENGEVWLSLHYQTGLRAAPDQVQVEPAPDPYDPLPFVRLRMAGPVTRVVLTWENR
jgi:hypothetical protein